MLASSLTTPTPATSRQRRDACRQHQRRCSWCRYLAYKPKQLAAAMAHRCLALMAFIGMIFRRTSQDQPPGTAQVAFRGTSQDQPPGTTAATG
eukprot:6646132-Heterocapsa_arctica.AAC.1